MDRYLDIQIPALDPAHHDAFLAHLLDAVTEAGLACDGNAP
jgi:hypothetical protein